MQLEKNINLEDLLSNIEKKNTSPKIKELRAEDVHESFMVFDEIINRLYACEQRIYDYEIKEKTFSELYSELIDPTKLMMFTMIISKVIGIMWGIMHFFVWVKFGKGEDLLEAILGFCAAALFFGICFFAHQKEEKNKLKEKKEKWSSETNQKLKKEHQIIRKSLSKEMLFALLESKYDFINAQTKQIVDEEFRFGDHFDSKFQDKEIRKSLEKMKQRILENIKIMNLNLVAINIKREMKQKN